MAIQERQTVLLVQNNATDTAVVVQTLNNAPHCNFQISQAQTCTDGEAMLKRWGEQPGSDPVAILLELFLPDSEGIQTFDRLFSLAPQIPIMVFCEDDCEDVAILAVQRGAQDYLLKSRIDDYSLPKILASMIERAAHAEAMFAQKERAQITLNSIGDGVVSTDERCRITYLNRVAEKLTGWTKNEAVGKPFEDVFCIVDAISRIAIPNPMARAIVENRTVGLNSDCVLVRGDGQEAYIEDSSSPIHDRLGRVTGAVMVFHDVSPAREQALRMAYLAAHDSLTDLPNRTLFRDRLDQAIALAVRNNLKLGVLYLDMDHFKRVNDSLGHAIGDRLLQSIAQRLLECVRQSDTVSRQGGDEFVVLLPQLNNENDAAVIAEKILNALSRPHQIDAHQLHLTVSIGIATYPEQGATGDMLIKHADMAMYHAKKSGHGTFQFFQPTMTMHVVERQSFETDLRRALLQKEFALYYQPVIQLDTGELTSAEALLRWHHPLRGTVFPGQFIQIAEMSGLIIPIGQWVFREVCRQARAWLDSGLEPMRIAINISAAELRAQNFVENVRDILRETDVDPNFLELELTETFLMKDCEFTVSTLQALREMGMHLTLDDFGTGYSSLSHLRRFPIKTLKIDYSFVRNLTSDANDASIVRAVINMGKSLNLRVVAEGVETQEQLNFLKYLGCLEGQGYFFNRPLSADAFTELLTSATDSQVVSIHA